MSLMRPRPFVDTDFCCYKVHQFNCRGANPGITLPSVIRGKGAA